MRVRSIVGPLWLLAGLTLLDSIDVEGRNSTKRNIMSEPKRLPHLALLNETIDGFHHRGRGINAFFEARF